MDIDSVQFEDKRRWGRTLSFVVMIGLVLGIGLVTGVVAYSFLRPPDFKSLRASVPVKILTAAGKPSVRRVGPKTSDWVPLKRISDYFLMAVISSEDTSFFQHDGVDFHELREAIKKDIQEKRWARGASTITQQVVKNVFLSSEKSLIRKLLEVMWAWQLDKKLSKSEILCFYANMVELGPGIYGIGRASRYYFGVSPLELTPRQAAFLAMLLPAPRKYYVYYREKVMSPWATARVNRILEVMFRLGFLTSVERQGALAEHLWGEGGTVSEVDPLKAVDSGEDPFLERFGIEGLGLDLTPDNPSKGSSAGDAESTVDYGSGSQEGSSESEVSDTTSPIN